ncbi:MAG: hypothetical protein HY741_25910 [Chloroflexi bacterium]|nr:hypothetical protein [Chloroflexota bacterium]
MDLADIHCRVGLSVIFFAFVLGAWGVIAFLMGRGVSGNYFGALIIGEVLTIAQALLGVILIIMGRWPTDVLHFLYGIVVILAWLMVYVYTKGATTRRELIIYALVSFFVMGLAMRGITTAGTAPSCLAF